MTDRTRVTLADMDGTGETEGESLVITVAGDIVASGVTGGGGSLEIQEDDAQKVTNTTIINFEGGAAVTDEGSGKATVVISGGAGPGDADFTIWSPDAEPASPSSYDDEFDDSSFDTGLWTEFDVATTQTPTEAEFGLHFVTSSTAHVQGAFQVAPASAGWSIMTKVAWLHPQSDDMKAGLLLMEDYQNPSTSDCFYWASYRGGAGNGFQAEYYNDYANHNSTPKNDAHSHYPTTVYLRIRAEGTVWDLDWSIDGLSWIQLHTMTRSFTPDAFGICQRVSTASDMKAVFPFFRYSTDVDCSDILYGDRIKQWRN